MTALCCVAHADILIFFYLCICLFIDEEEGNALAESCAAPLKLILLQISTCIRLQFQHGPAVVPMSEALQLNSNAPSLARVATFSDLKCELDLRTDLFDSAVRGPSLKRAP